MAALPVDVQAAVETHLLRLAADPVANSRKSGFPHPRTGQRFNFRHDKPNVTYHFSAFFYYSVDETEILFFDLTSTAM